MDIAARDQAEPTFEDRLKAALTILNIGDTGITLEQLQDITEQLQGVMVADQPDVTGACRLNDLAAVVSQVCSQGYDHASIVAFLWIDRYLPTALRGFSNVDYLTKAVHRGYGEYGKLFDDESLLPMILAGRGGIESYVLKGAANCLRNKDFRLDRLWEHYCKLAFCNGYIKSVVAGGVNPVKTHRACALLMVGEQLFVGDHQGVKFEDVIAYAKDICPLIDLDFGTFVPAGLEPRKEWFQLGRIYAAAVLFIADNEVDIEAARPRVKYIHRVDPPSSLPFPFLQTAVSCFNGGSGRKRASLLPTMDKWMACQRGGEAGHQQLCVKVLGDVLDHAAKAQIQSYHDKGSTTSGRSLLR